MSYAVRIALVVSAALAASALGTTFAHADATTLAAPVVPIESTGKQTGDARWATLREHYFGAAEIVPGDDVIALDAPLRAHDAAAVPIAVHALDPGTVIRRVHLIVDQNPLPLAGIFTFDEKALGWRSFATRVRIDRYTHVRAIAELGDGALAMVSRFVKASGGCSAPAMADMDAALERAGAIRLLIDEATADATRAGEGTSPLLDRTVSAVSASVSAQRSASVTVPPTVTATIAVSHPNNSGMQFDQVSRNYIPAFYVQHIGATLDDEPFVDVETNFSLSENPTIDVSLPSGAAHGTLDVFALDSDGNRHESRAAFPSGS